MISRNSRRTSSSRSGPSWLRSQRHAQHLRLALGTVEIDGVAGRVLGDADLLREPGALVDQRVELRIDAVDALADLLERQP